MNFFNKIRLRGIKITKNVTAISSLIFLSHIGFSQEIGARFGDVVGNNVAVDAVFKTGKFNRLHADVSFGSNGVGAEVLWDFLYKPLDGDALNWYVGVGPSAFLGSPFLLGASGEIGLEYRFNEIPLVLGLDWRPTLFIVEKTDFSTRGFGFNVRFVFAK
jgi:hypothetical protein